MFLASSRVNKTRKQWKAITSPASRSFRGLTRCTFQPSGAAWPRVALPLSFLNLEMSPTSHSTHSRLWIQRLCMALLPRDVAEIGFNKHSTSIQRAFSVTTLSTLGSDSEGSDVSHTFATFATLGLGCLGCLGCSL